MMIRRFTGYHMAVILVTFFGVVISVNMVMAVFASRTFGGTVVDNSYVASQQFNRWLAEARKEKALGVEARIELNAQRRLMLTVNPALLGPNAVPAGHAEHPLGGMADIPLRFVSIGPGRFQTEGMIPNGRWIVRLSLATLNGRALLLERVG